MPLRPDTAGRGRWKPLAAKPFLAKRRCRLSETRGEPAMATKSGFVAVHLEDGIYLGGSSGRALWSRVDDVGPIPVPAFPSEADARAQVAASRHPDECAYPTVPMGDDLRVSPETLRSAGLGAHLGFISALRYVAVHPDQGVYLGGCEGGVVSWWSRDDGMASTPGAPTFGDPLEGISWLGGGDPEPWMNDVSFREVRADLPRCRASAEAMREAGLEDADLGEMAYPGWANGPGRC